MKLSPPCQSIGFFPTHSRAAFSLIELLVVVSIIALLIAMLLPALGTARETARQVQCASNQRQVAIGFRMYLTDFDGWFPFAQAGNSPDFGRVAIWHEALASEAQNPNRGTMDYFPAWAVFDGVGGIETLRDDSPMHCPSNATMDALASSPDSALLSYSYPARGTTLASGEVRKSLGGWNTPNASNYLLPRKVDEYPRASEVSLLIEGGSDFSGEGDADTVDGDSFLNQVGPPSDDPDGIGRHGGNRAATNITFIDGHTRLFKNGPELHLQWTLTAVGQLEYPFNIDPSQ